MARNGDTPVGYAFGSAGLPGRLPAGKGLIIGSGPIAGSIGADCDTADPAREDPQFLSARDDESYDFLYAGDVLQTLSRPSVALANWLRVVRPGGVVALTVPRGGERSPGTAGSNGSGTGAAWRFAMQEPATEVGGANLLELLQVVCHLAEIDYVAGVASGQMEALLRKRPKPLTPVQSNTTPEIQTLTKLTESAIAARAQWRPMDEFEAILASGVREATVVDLSRLYLLYQWLLMTLRLPGDCIEVGSFRGGTAKLISETLLRRNASGELHLFDTFAGMPEQLSFDEAGLKGCFADTSVEAVRRLLANNPRVHLHAGIFPETIPPELRSHRFRFAHIDVDIERSVRDCLDFVYPRLLPGGVIVIDDYGHAECPGATRAVEAFFEGKPETVVQMPLVSSAVVVRIGDEKS